MEELQRQNEILQNLIYTSENKLEKKANCFTPGISDTISLQRLTTASVLIDLASPGANSSATSAIFDPSNEHLEHQDPGMILYASVDHLLLIKYYGLCFLMGIHLIIVYSISGQLDSTH